MRFLHLRLQQYAHFTDVRLDFSQSCEGLGLHLIYGPNEAGKSAALRAIRGFLFGIPAQTPDTFRFGGPALRVVATLRGADGTVRTLIRRKGLKQTLRDDHDEPVSEVLLQDLLGGIPPERFTLLFGLGHAELVEGGKELLRSGGAAGESLFAAAVGGARLQRLLTDLAARADSLFKAKASAPPLNKALGEYKAIQGAIRDLSTPGKTVAELRAREAALQQKIQALESALTTTRTERARLERLQKAIPLIGDYRIHDERLAALAHIPDLPEDFAKRRHETQRDLDHVRAEIDQMSEKRDRLLADLEGLDIPETLLQHGDAIKRLHGDLTRYQSARQDLPTQQRLEKTHRRVAAAILTELRPWLTMEEADQLRVSAVDRERLRECGEALRGCLVKLEQAQKDRGRLEQGREDTERRLAAAPMTPDTSTLRQALELARPEIATEREVTDLRHKQGALRNKAAALLARLGLWSGTLEAFEVLAVPSLETLEETDRLFTTLAADLQARSRRSEEAQEALARAVEAIQGLQGAGAVRTEADLRTARRDRDAQWVTIRQTWLDVGTGTPAASEVLNTYEGAVDAADGVADRLRREADRVTQHARTAAERDRLIEQVAIVKAEIDALHQREAEVREYWEALWRPCNIQPLPPREMRPWLQHRQELLGIAEELRTLQTRLETLGETVATHRSTLSHRLTEVGESPAQPIETLQELCARIEAWLQATDARRKEREGLERDREKLLRQEIQADWDRQAAALALTDVRSAWEAVVAPLGLGADASPNQAMAALTRIAELFNARDLAEEKGTRVLEIEGFITAYAQQARTLFEQVAPDLLSVPVEEAVQTLEHQRDAAAKRAVRREGLLGQVQETGRALETAAVDRATHERTFEGLLQEAGCQSLADLPRVETDAAEKRTCRAQRAHAETLLRQIAGTGSLEALIAEAASTNRDALPAALASLEQESIRLDADLKQSYGDVAVAANDLKAIAGDAQAADKAVDAQALLARIRTDAAAYLRARLAASVLQREIERYRERHEGELVHAAGTLFSQLTCEAFAGLGERLGEKDTPVLVALRTLEGRREEVPMDGLSDGTRDQLYLALRLAYLRRHLSQSPPFPLILDDILVNYDDDRVVASLRVLGELSRQMQVLLFTHHRHLLPLAEAAVPAGTLFSHTLQ